MRSLIKTYKNSWNFSRGEVSVMTLAFNLFMVTEILVFLLLFWAWFHASATPTVWMGNTWPTTGITAPKWWGMGMYNTVVLFISSCFVTWGELNLKLSGTSLETLTSIAWGVFASVHFLTCQYIEFSSLPFYFKDSMYGTLFYSITGLHLVHVLMGTMLLTLTLLSIMSLVNNKNFN